jgi:hypothetical protein
MATAEYPKISGSGKEIALVVERESNRCGGFSAQTLPVHDNVGLLVERSGVGAVTGPTLWTLFKFTSPRTKTDSCGGKRATRRGFGWEETETI